MNYAVKINDFQATAVHFSCARYTAWDQNARATHNIATIAIFFKPWS